eukprot:1914433-Amphidinium_carterae.1
MQLYTRGLQEWRPESDPHAAHRSKQDNDAQCTQEPQLNSFPTGNSEIADSKLSMDTNVHPKQLLRQQPQEPTTNLSPHQELPGGGEAQQSRVKCLPALCGQKGFEAATKPVAQTNINTSCFRITANV